MRIEEFKEELNNIGIEDSENRTNAILNSIYKSEDPVLQEIISSGDDSKFISTYLTKLLNRIQESPSNIENILQSSNKIVEEVKKVSPIYIKKKEEIERKIVRDNKYKIEEFKATIKENAVKFENSFGEERYKMTIEALRKTGCPKECLKETAEFDMILHEYGALQKKNEKELTPEQIERKRSIEKYIRMVRDDTTGKYKYVQENIFNNVDKQEGKINYEDISKKSDEFFRNIQIRASREEAKGLTKEEIYENISEIYQIPIEEVKRIVQNPIIYNGEVKAVDEVSNDAENVETGTIEMLKSNEESARTNIYGNLEKMTAEDFLEKAEELGEFQIEVEEDIFEMSEDDFFAQIEANMASLESGQESPFDELLDLEETVRDVTPLTNEEGKAAIDEHGEEVDISAVEVMEKEGVEQGENTLGEIEDATLEVAGTVAGLQIEEVEVGDTDLENAREQGTNEIAQEEQTGLEENVQTAMVEYKPRFIDRFKNFAKNIAEKGLVDSFKESFLSSFNNDFYTNQQKNKEDNSQKSSGENLESQNNLAQEQAIKDQTEKQGVVEKIKKFFGVKTEVAESVAENLNNEKDTKADSNKKTDIESNSPSSNGLTYDPELSKKVAEGINKLNANPKQTTVQNGKEAETEELSQ